MKDYNEEYFYMMAGGVNFPAVDFTGASQIGNSFMFFEEEAIDDQTVVPLKFSDPVPRKPQLADVHAMASNRVISTRIKEILESFSLKNVQFVPATVEDKNGNEIEGYYIPHIYNLIRCVDTQKSEYRDKSRNANIPVYDIKKLVLDNEVLDQIPLEDRLVFALEEQGLKRLYHRSVVEKILALKPDGVAFYQLSTYDPKKPFQAAYMDYLLNGED